MDDAVPDAVPDAQPDIPSGPESDEDPSDVSQAGADDEDAEPAASAYHSLLQSFDQNAAKDKPRRKRRKLEHSRASAEEVDDAQQQADAADDSEAEQVSAAEQLRAVEAQVALVEQDEGDDVDSSDPFERHFAAVDEKELEKRLRAVKDNQWITEKVNVADEGRCMWQIPKMDEKAPSRRKLKEVGDIKLKPRLETNAQSMIGQFTDLEPAIVPAIFDYQDLLFCGRTVQNAPRLRHITCLHALNHIFKTRDRVIKNNAKLSHSPESADLELRDQGFARPKVLFLLETKQACVRVIESVTQLCNFEQQENKKRFLDSFSLPSDKFSDDKPSDFRELFEGNDENEFRLGLKFTRKTLKFFAKFYNSDIILSSPLGLRRAIEANGDPKKTDYDFLSSVEMVIHDQADATQMQNWEHLEYVFAHLNLQPRSAHDCDFSRVRNWYLDGLSSHFRQTIILSAYLTPSINALWNKSMRNWAGRCKYTPVYTTTSTNGNIPAIENLTHLGIKQTFSRFASPTHLEDPDARFKFWQTSTLPWILKLAKTHQSQSNPGGGGVGVVLYIPSYLDFVRLRNSLVDSPLSYASISEYTTPTDVRKARSHFMSGRHSLLLYTERAHHFHRYKIRGVKKVVFWGVPTNPRFYEEAVGWIGESVGRAEIRVEEAGVRASFSRWEAMEVERVVGTSRVGSLVGGERGDVFDFI
ncbi:hypothetical protein BCR34DRAFT_601573 [Clohesyomyces aquaticus]|uniref:U3 small nucleolar RNA-associated protein 25 n=1 Tax=Clohesyomyces aquaticus TaxID=1231657 RepID=A0A1Y1ZLH8_9PLEO|nr:hypothetical protein BCR34DRAFT_601573 [Clohesyomyces aquaticus]